MAKTLHAVLDDLRLPYRSFDSPTSTDPMWQDGRNCLSDPRGVLRRRPGFGAKIELVPTTFNNVQRIYSWQRWDGTSNAGYYLMISDLGDDGLARVYKYRFGYDVSAQLIFTSASGNPFSFVAANNWCFFGNEVEMMKYDGTHVYKWGIVKPASAPSVTTDSGYIASTGDTNSGVQYGMTYGSSLTGHESSMSPLSGKVVPQEKLIVLTTKVGIFGPVEALIWGDSSHSTNVGQYVYNSASDPGTLGGGAIVRDATTAAVTTLGTSLLFDETGGTASKPVGWTEFDTSNSGVSIGTIPLFPAKLETEGFQDFNCCITCQIYLPAAGDYSFEIASKDDVMWGFDDRLTWAGKGTITGSQGQTITVANGLPLLPRTRTNDGAGYKCSGVVTVTAPEAGQYTFEVDWDYWYHSGRKLTVKHNGQNILPVAYTKVIQVSNTLGLTASSDPQVDQIHVYRTTLGGSADPNVMQELPDSPYPNTTATLPPDTTDDELLLPSYGPGFYSNDPPPLSRGFQWSQNRVWSFAKNTLYYSGYEEIIKGVYEECWPSGTDGNYKPYSRAIHALVALPTGVDILTSGAHYGVDGDSLDTFRWLTLAHHRGTKGERCAIPLGSAVLWFDTSRQLWSSGGSEALQQASGIARRNVNDQGEVGLDIRPDLALVDATQATLVAHIFGESHWLCLLDSPNDKLWVLNLDTMQWQVPWTLSASTIHSGETADGQVDLIVALGGKKLYKLTPSTYKDGVAPYDGWVRGNLYALGKGDISVVVDHLEIERNSVPLVDVLQANDDNTQTATYTSIREKRRPPLYRGNGLQIVSEIFPSNPTGMNTNSANCKRASFELRWGTESSAFELYSMDVAYHAAAGG